jgi:hypothetical protein
MRNATPALGSLFGGLGQVLLSPLRNHGSQGGNTEFSRLLDGPLHVIKLVNSHNQGYGQRGIGLYFGYQVEANLIRGDCRKLGVKDVAACHDIRFHAGLRAQNTRHVRGLRACNRGCGLIPVFGNPASARHGG